MGDENRFAGAGYELVTPERDALPPAPAWAIESTVAVPVTELFADDDEE